MTATRQDPAMRLWPMLLPWGLAALAVAQDPVSRPLTQAHDGEGFAALKEQFEQAKLVRKRSLAIELGATRDPRAYDLLLPLLAKKDMRAFAAQGLGALGDRRAFEPIASLYDEERNDPLVQDLVPKALLDLDPTRALPVVLARFANDDRAMFPLERLLQARNEPAVREAMHALLENGDLNHRLAAVRVLAKVGDGRSVDLLIQLWERDPETRSGIAAAFASLRERKVANFLADELPRAQHPHLRATIAQALGDSGQPRVAKRLCEMLATEAEAMVKVRMLEALGRLGEPRALATVARFLTDEGATNQPPEVSTIRGYPENVRVRSVAAWAMLALRDGSAPCPVAALSSFPSDLDAGLRERLAAAAAWWAANQAEAKYRFER